MSINDVRKAFPNLGETATLTSPADPDYNCIAYAAGDNRRWWWPDPYGFVYWPPGCPRVETVFAFQSAFESLGYVLCSDSSLEIGQEKIAIFHKNLKPTHAARQLNDGTWTSKLGRWFDISHDVHCLTGHDKEAYGDIAIFMSRHHP